MEGSDEELMMSAPVVQSDLPKVSVVIPIFNVERYLKKCVDSLLGQTLQNIEVVLVDDGSPDRSGDLADSYAALDSRVKVVHRENGGLGPARNSGIDAALGEYIGFVDGDDWALPGMFERLYAAAVSSDADIVCGGHCTYSGDEVTGTFEHPLAGAVLRSHDEIMHVRKNLYGHKVGDRDTKSFPVTVCSNIYRRSFVVDNALRFRDILSEDTMFNLPAFKCAGSIAFTDGVDYCYRKDGQASITNTLSPKALLRSERFIDALFSSASSESEPDREDCQMRARYAAVEYSRLYVGMVSRSGLSKGGKLVQMRRLVESRLFSEFASSYPEDKLRPYQRSVQAALLHGNLSLALRIVALRTALGKLR